MPDNPPLSDEQVYELLQQCRHLIQGRTAATMLGYTALEQILRDIDVVQTAMIMMREATTDTPQ
jgi:hypothetical protein